MITKKELIGIAKESGLDMYQQEKEYLLKLFLYFYYGKFEDAVFKGGTAIRFAESLNRFSEDLDFNINHPKNFLKQVGYVLKEITKVGIVNSFLKSELFKDSFTCEIIFQGPLYQGNPQTRNKFRIDAGTRMGTLDKPLWRIIQSQYPETKERFAVKMMSPGEILCEKVIAMLNRKKGRDLYDVWFLLNSGVELDKSLFRRKLKNTKLDIKDFITESDYIRDTRYLVARVMPYSQLKEEVLHRLKKIGVLKG